MAKDKTTELPEDGLWHTQCRKCGLIATAHTPPESDYEWECPKCGNINKETKAG